MYLIPPNSVWIYKIGIRIKNRTRKILLRRIEIQRQTANDELLDYF
jgi:hypothetical protein